MHDAVKPGTVSRSKCLVAVSQKILPVPYFASERSFAQFRLSEEVRHPVNLAHNTALQSAG